MTKYTGRTSQIAIGGPETTPGTIVTPTNWLSVRDFNFEDKDGYVESEQTSGSLFKTQDAKLERVWAEGGWIGDIQDDSFGYILRMASGSPSTYTAKTATEPEIHRFKFSQNENHLPYTIYEKHAIQDRSWAYGKLSSLSINQAMEEFITYNAQFMARKSVDASALTAASVDETIRFTSPEFTAKIAAAKTGLAAAVNLKVTEFSFEINKNVSNEFVSGRSDRNPDDIINKELELSGSFTLHFENEDQKDKVFASTSQAMSILMSNGATGVNERSLEIVMEKLYLMNFERVWGSNDALMQTINFRVVDRGIAGTTKDVIEFILKNNKAGAYA